MTALYLPQWRQAIAEQEAALRRCDTEQELEDAWFASCAVFSERSRECIHLRKVYAQELDRVRAMAEQRDLMLRYARAS